MNEQTKIPLYRVNFRSHVDGSSSVSANNVVSLYLDHSRNVIVIVRKVEPHKPNEPTTTIVPMGNVASYWEDESKKPVAVEAPSKVVTPAPKKTSGKR